jgi:hypothetical protein
MFMTGRPLPGAKRVIARAGATISVEWRKKRPPRYLLGSGEVKPDALPETLATAAKAAQVPAGAKAHPALALKIDKQLWP